MRAHLVTIVAIAVAVTATSFALAQAQRPQPSSDAAIVRELRKLNATTKTGLRRIHVAIGISDQYSGLRGEQRVHFQGLQMHVDALKSAIDDLGRDIGRTCRALGGTSLACPF